MHVFPFVDDLRTNRVKRGHRVLNGYTKQAFRAVTSGGQTRGISFLQVDQLCHLLLSAA